MKPTSQKDPATSAKKQVKTTVDNENELLIIKRLLQVEASLEKVRLKALQMKRSDELKEVIAIIFKEMEELGFDLYDTNIAIVDKTNNDITFFGSGLGGVDMPPEFKVPYLPGEEPYFDQVYEDIKKRKSFRSTVLEGKRLRDYHKFTLNKTDFKNAPKEYLDEMLSVEKVVLTYATMSKGFLEVASDNILAEDKINILKRFARVVDLTYTRFDDLQKAEGQARESQIEAALEKVRSRSLAMHKAEELGEVAAVVLEKLRELDMPVADGVAIVTHIEGSKDQIEWMESPDHPSAIKVYQPYYDHPILDDYWKAKNKGLDFIAPRYNAEVSRSFFNHIFTFTDYKHTSQEIKDYCLAAETYSYFAAFQKNSSIFINDFSGRSLSDQEIDIIKRFSKVFEQAYVRFLDLQKAESQAREAQIEAALERVRSRSMGMQKSEELKEVIQMVFDQLIHLKINVDHAGFVVDYIPKGDWHFWIADKQQIPSKITHPYFDSVWANQFDEAKEKGINFFETNLNFEEKNKFYQDLLSYIPGLSEQSKEFYFNCPGLAASNVLLENVALYIENFSAIPYTDEENDILKRIGKVFQQTYTRFLDLKRAEAQAREAEIEAALERVRAKAMAMHKSEELGEVSILLYEQLKSLGIADFFNCGYVEVDLKRKIQRSWMTRPDGSSPGIHQLPLRGDHILNKRYNAWKKQHDIFHQFVSGEKLKKHIEFVSPHFANKEIDIIVKSLPDPTIFYCGNFQFGYLHIVTGTPLNKEAELILARFAKVFEQAYTRFLDLQKAEAQAREAQIEAALERVRAKAMGMHSSNDLSITASMVFTELRKLGVNSIRSGVGLFSKESRKVQLYSAIPSATGDSLSLVGWVQLEKHPVLEKIYETWLMQEDYFPVMQGEELRSYYQSLLTGLSVPMPEFKNDEKQFGHFISSSIGCLYAWSEEDLNGDQLKILRRFASIIDLTFRRYLELQKAEAQALEAVKQASLDRVRAEISSMRTADDLNRITPLIWRELTTLGVPFFRCGVFIVDDEAKKIDSYLSNPEGESLAAWSSDYDTIPLFKASVKAWKQQQVYRTEWDKNQFIEFSRILVDQGLVRDVKRYQAGMNAPDYLSLQMIPFKQGMLYVGSAEKLKEDQIELVQTLTSAFSIAYSRYEDFRQLEKAKSEVEQTLTELKSTQTQLIHSEKMASLGELTAGIAHEIQNPLNFVNNFSEVSEELIEELIEELSNGDLDEARAISNNVIENLRKINHHGQRASSIVKGMLEHSRSGTNKKELTDINILADEYLRLAYHGLRAKDKTFQAEFKTDLDSAIPKIKLIGQEIGRVLLNLINNAFYAVSEKSKRARNDYVPTVIIQTKRQGNIAEIRVKDNADGIPANVVDKIFQPFFTTKPSGHGTGLGLSLSYDIITKGHDGYLEVDTQEGIGTEFIIRIPII